MGSKYDGKKGKTQFVRAMLIFTFQDHQKEQQQPNGHLPYNVEQLQLEPEIQQIPHIPHVAQAVQQQAPQRINPFLEEPDDEEGDTVTVEQVVSFLVLLSFSL
jgi:hypothetical protein